MSIDHGLTNIERSTYSTLDLFGDVGGLFEGLKTLAAIFISPIAGFALRTELLANAFKIIETGHDK